MKILTHIYRTMALLPLLLPLLLTEGCEVTELCYDHYPRAAVSFGWEREWERDYGMAHSANWDDAYHGFGYSSLRPGTPEWINLVKFRGTTADGEHYLTPDGGDVLLDKPDGYSFLLYNGDTEYVILSDVALLSDARATATSRSRATITEVMERHPAARSSNPPDMLYSSFIESVPPIAVHEFKQIDITMQPLVYTYLVRYEFAHGLQHVALARGALGGMAESVYLRDGRTSDKTAIVLYDCEVRPDCILARVRSFGAPGLPDSHYGRAGEPTPAAPDLSGLPFTLNLEVMLTNGSTLQFNYDIADQISKQPRGGVITISGIRVEDDQNSAPISGDFDVDLSGWGVVDVDLPFQFDPNLPR